MNRLTRNFVLFLNFCALLFILFNISTLGQQLSLESKEEQITITTYYPAPYGVYNQLKTKKMAIGENYYTQQYCWDPTCSNVIPANVDLIVEGNVGIGTINPTSKLEIRGNVNISDELKVNALRINNYRFPTSDGSEGYCLRTDGKGQLYWGRCAPEVETIVFQDHNQVIRAVEKDGANCRFHPRWICQSGVGNTTASRNRVCEFACLDRYNTSQYKVLGYSLRDWDSPGDNWITYYNITHKRWIEKKGDSSPFLNGLTCQCTIK